MREAASRLVNFDPVFDLPCSEYPLPRPWDHEQEEMERYQHHSRMQEQYAAANEFACPRPPRRSHY